MKKTLILAAFGLLASVALPAFASDSPAGTYIEAKEAPALNQQTIKESSTTFVIAERAGKVKDGPGDTFTAKMGGKDDFMFKRLDSGPTAPGLITASHDKVKGGVMIFSTKSDSLKGNGLVIANKTRTVGLDLKTAPMTSASAQGASNIAGVEAKFFTT